VFCWAIESRVAERVHTYEHFARYVTIACARIISLGFRVGAQKRNGTKSFFFFFFFYTASQQSFHNIISPLLPLPDRLYAGIAVCVCVYIGSFIIPSPGRFFLVIDGFCFPSRCVAFGPVYPPYNNKAPLCFHLRT